MSDPQVFLIAMYQEHCTQARQHEDLRQHSTALLLTLAGGAATVQASLVALILDNLDGLPSVLSFVALSGLGLLIVYLAGHGKSLSLKHYAKNREHTVRIRIYREFLERLHPGKGYDRLSTVDKYKGYLAKELAKLPPLPPTPVHAYWAGIFNFVRGLGWALFFLCLGLAALVFWLQVIRN